MRSTGCGWQQWRAARRWTRSFLARRAATSKLSTSRNVCEPWARPASASSATTLCRRRFVSAAPRKHFLSLPHCSEDAGSTVPTHPPTQPLMRNCLPCLNNTSYNCPCRGGALTSEFRWSKFDDSVRYPEGETSAEDMWSNYDYFLKAVIPTGESLVGLQVAASTKFRSSFHPSMLLLDSRGGWRVPGRASRRPAAGAHPRPGSHPQHARGL